MKKFILAACALGLTASFASAQEMHLRHDADDASRGAIKVRPDAETRRAMDSYNMMNSDKKTMATTHAKKNTRLKHDVR